MVVVPCPTMVTVLPITVATERFELVYVTVNPEEAVAFKEKGGSLTFFATNEPNVMVCVALFTVSDWLTAVAAL